MSDSRKRARKEAPATEPPPALEGASEAVTEPERAGATGTIAPVSNSPSGSVVAREADVSGESGVTSEGLAPEPDFIKLEKNLASMGFFSPASKNTKKPVAKTVEFTRLLQNKRVTASVTIAPSVIGALPTTADQDKYLAFQKLVLDRRQEGELIQNPVAFTSYELLRLLGSRLDAGKNYQDVARWLGVMTETTIRSEGAVYFSGSRSFATDTFHVFDRAVSVGRELPDGTVADRNYVWLSQWQIENINNNYLLPIDFDAYKKLTNHIAKALVPLLQIWLFASEQSGAFEKRYDELCQQLHLTQYQYLSKIKEKLGPALDELAAHRYITAWDVAPAADGRNFKVVFTHGAKYFGDKAQRAARPLEAPSAKPRGQAAGPKNQNAGPKSRNAAPKGRAAHPGTGRNRGAGEAAGQMTLGETPPAALGAVLAGLGTALEGLAAPPPGDGVSGTAHPPAAPDRAAARGTAPEARPGAPVPAPAAPDTPHAEPDLMQAEPDTAQAEEVCRHFHQALYKTGTEASLLASELAEASELVQRHGLARARHVVDYFQREIAPGTRFRPATICGLRPHVARAVADFDQRARTGRGPTPAPGAQPPEARLAHARQRHVAAFREAFDGYRRETLGRLQETQPEAWRAFLAHEAELRKREGEGKFREIREVAQRHFDREEHHLNRVWTFLADKKDWGVLSFWEWDVRLNPKAFTKPDADPPAQIRKT